MFKQCVHQAMSFISNCTILTKQQKVEGVHIICNPCFVALQLCEFRYFLELTESYFAQLRRNLIMSIDVDSIPGLGRSHGEEKGYPLQFSGLENSMDSQETDPDLPVSIQESLVEVWVSCGL